MPGNFRRSQAGDALIRQELQKLMDLEVHKYGANTIMGKDGKVALTKLPGGHAAPVWESLVERGPNAIHVKFSKVRAREEFGKHVHAFFCQLYSQLNKDPPARATFVRFLEDIEMGTVAKVGEWDV